MDPGDSFEHGWVSYDREKGTLEQFLEKWKPSCTRSILGHVQWLCISSKKASRKWDDVDTTGLKLAWDALCSQNQNRMTKEDVETLALKHNVLSGKWMIFLDKKDVDEHWARVAGAVLKGFLGTDAKVSTGFMFKPKPEKPSKGPKKRKVEVKLKEKKWKGETHVLCVYSSCFTDLVDAFKIRDALKLLGFEGQLQYKPDAYTACGLYQKNMWGLPPVAFYG